MNIRINKIAFNSKKIVLYFIFIMGIACNYVEHYLIWQAVSLLLFIMLLIQTKSKDVGTYLLLAFNAFYLLTLSIITTSNINTYQNVKVIVFPLLLVCNMYIIIKNDVDVFYSFLDDIFVFVLGWFFLNVFIVFKQLDGTGFLIKNEWLQYNSYYIDQCCGLFGNSQTSNLAAFSIMTFIMTLANRNRFKNKIIIYVLITIELILILYLSTLNDNKSVFILLPLFLALYIYINIEKTDIPPLAKILSYIKMILVIALAIYVISKIPFVQEEVLVRLNEILYFKNNNIYGSNERLAIIQYALDNRFGWMFGAGIGEYSFAQSWAFGFKHFGLSDASSIISLCGIWFYISWCVLYTKLSMVQVDKMNSRYVGIIIFIIYIIFSLYCNPFTSATMCIWILFIIVMIFREKKSIVK